MAPTRPPLPFPADQRHQLDEAGLGHPNSILGSERELVGQIRAGITEFALVGSIVNDSYPQ